jgi:tRNA pseudouridine55 synthase
VHGVLLLDKPLGLSSNQALQKAKWLLRAEKAGHTGTLDPLASGVLPICLGAATKFSQLHLDADKTYETVVRLGVTTTTGDAEGDVLDIRPVTCSAGQVVQVLDHFTGPITQIPPMHSALKKDGKALYEYAREGRSVEREARAVTIHELELLQMQLQGETPLVQPLRPETDSASPEGSDPRSGGAWGCRFAAGPSQGESAPPGGSDPRSGGAWGPSFLRLRVRCSKGTYIRTLGEDIARALGCGGHLSMLRRVQTGPFTTEQCITLEALEAMHEAERLQCLLPVQALLPDHTPITLGHDDAGRLLSGLRRRGDWPDQPRVAIYGPPPTTGSTSQVLLGSGHILAGELIPGRLLSPIEIQQILEPATS